MRELSKDNLLRSWKDISAHLGVDVRTCHRWEAKHGMPVHRAEGTEKKSLVFAYKDELDAWFKRTFRNHKGAREEEVPAGKGRPGLKWLLAAVTVFVLAGGFFLVRGLLARGQPADFSIDGSFLVVLDKQHRELWRWDSKYENLMPESYYRRNFQIIHEDVDNILPVLVISDIDGDGDQEVLFAPKRVSDQTGEGWLRCFNHKGKEIWHFKANKELRSGVVVYSPDYRIAGFYTHDFDGDGRHEIVVEAFHAPDWPCQLTLLDASGKLLGDYMHAGYLRDIEFFDLDSDGIEELIVVGINKEYRTGCLIVFDPRDFGGRSPQSGEFAFEDLKPGTELFYVVTPPTDVSEALGPLYSDLRKLHITENRRIRATSSLGLIFEFDFGLKPLQVTWEDSYRTRHEALTAEGKISSVLGDAYRPTVLDGIRWWNGSELVAEPTRNAPPAPVPGEAR